MNVFVVGILGDDPDKYLHIFLAPILFDSFILYHPTLLLFLLLYSVLDDFLHILQSQLVYCVYFQFVTVLNSISTDKSGPRVPYHLCELSQSIPGLKKFVNLEGANGLVGFSEFMGGFLAFEEIVHFLLVGGILMMR